MKVEQIAKKITLNHLFLFLFVRVGLIFAERLKEVNNTFYHHHFPTTFHGAHLLLYGPLKFDIAYEMIEHIARKLRENL